MIVASIPVSFDADSITIYLNSDKGQIQIVGTVTLPGGETQHVTLWRESSELTSQARIAVDNLLKEKKVDG
jgi:hypothetical protein